MKHLFKAVTLVVTTAALALPALRALAQSSSPNTAESATASTAHQSSPADAADPRATVPPLAYRSAFQSYRSNTEAEVGNWKEANDKVGRIGGWRVYAKEATQPDAAASAPMPVDHSGHKSH